MPTCSKLLSAVSLAALFLAPSTNAADWPMHRGDPQLQGRAAEPAPKQPMLRWTFRAGNPVKGGAAIANGSAFFGDDGGVVHCVSLADGKETWKFEAEGGIEATPLVMDGRVFIGASNGKLYALDAASGVKKWEFETGDKILAGASWAKDPVSGAKWVLVGSYDFSLYALDTESGKQQWKVETENFINSTPAVTSGGYAIFGGCDALLHVVSLKERKEARAINAEAYIPGSAATDGKMVYLGNDAKKVFAFDIESGATAWSFRDRNFPYFSSPALSEKEVIIGGRDKRLHCIDRATGERKWYFSTKGDVDSSPVLCQDGGIVVGGLDGRLYCVELADGKERWNYEVGAKISGSPAIAGGVIVIGAEDGNVYCFGAKQ